MTLAPRYMLDTDTCIYIIKRKPPQVIARLYGMDRRSIGISAITGAELKFGAAKIGTAKSKLALEMFLAPMTVLPFGLEAMDIYGELRQGLQSKGTPIGYFDMLIAAHALAAGSTLVTNNVREFGRVPKLKFENWVE